MDIEAYARYKQSYTDYIPELFLEYFKNVSWNTFLDLGCGDGSLLKALKSRGLLNGKKVYAVDLSEIRIELVKKIDSNFVCLVRSVENLQGIEDKSIDFLASEQTIEHVDDQGGMVAEMARVLSGGGVIYLSTVFKKWYGWYFYRCNGKWTLDPTHLREYSHDRQLFDIFEKYGFEIIENKKTLISRSIGDFIIKRLKLQHGNAAQNPLVKMLRQFKIPVFGYYNWEVVLKKSISKKHG
jgi:2-polyprenyl-3-methyl-5-hydroxy-6-metoxy-1,4-benzoquinol methylase